MGTPAAVGVGTLEAGWDATFVGYDGYPEELGIRLLELVAAYKGDLASVWSYLSSVPNGWRHPFEEPYEDDWEHDFVVRDGPPLLSHTDVYITGDYNDGAWHLDGVMYWYLFDLEARCLRIYSPRYRSMADGSDPNTVEPRPTKLLHTATFDAAGAAQVEPPIELENGDDAENQSEGDS